ncbi:spore germination protein GerPC [Niallia oryzisoli]|uniref:spore germination protein GerPC n=1 Tax=Niallia oryzisoli TaxID=1737571 RepID=UPI003734D591
MSQNLYQAIQSIQAYVYAQDKTIRKLQKKIEMLEKKVTELNDRPPIRVEKMEYKFDQLKVETLEGTLNIGLNPSDLQGIEDFSVPSQNGVPNPKERMSMFTEIENSVHRYLDENLQMIMKNTGEQLQFRVDDTYRDFILQDIKKQLPSRIEYYLNQPIQNGSTQDQHKEWIFEQMKKEIHHGVLTFLQHLPENMKGPNQNEF